LTARFPAAYAPEAASSVTPLDSERSVSGRRMKDFRYVERLFP
jgi:hypothetical protein